MIRKLIIPQELGEIEVRLLEWVKAEGDNVSVGDALLEFETDKAIVLVTATQVGTMRRHLVSAGDWMKPGDVVAWLSDAADEPMPASDADLHETVAVTFDIT